MSDITTTLAPDDATDLQRWR